MDRWIRAAMIDDSMVAELLLLLRKSQHHPTVYPPQKWGLRQPRSRTFIRCEAAYHNNNIKKDVVGDRTRGSPTTPLSWSGGATASPSATADFNEASSLPSSRSKVNVTSETATASSKRSRKKKVKTYSQLREEESILVKDRLNLKTEIARLHASIKEQKARSLKLKRIKLDCNLQSVKKTSPDRHDGEDSNKSQRVELCNTNQVPSAFSMYPNSCKVEMEVVSHQRGAFMLPDLNMMPSDEDSGSRVLY